MQHTNEWTESARDPYDLKAAQTLELPKILGLLASFAVTEEGRRKALALEPSADFDNVSLRQRETNDAKNLMGQKGAPNIGSVREVYGAVLRAEKGASLSLRELLDVAAVLSAARQLKAYLDDQVDSSSPLNHWYLQLQPHRTVEERLTTAIVSEEDLADNASPELARIRRQKNQAALRAREALQKMIRSQSFQKLLQEPIITMRGDRFVVPVKAEHRGEVAGLVHDTSGSGATVFIEPLPVVEANNEVKVLAAKEEEEIDRIIAELSAMVGEIAPTVRGNYGAVVSLDLIFAKAKFSYSLRAASPALNQRGRIVLNEARHPLIDKSKVVPTNIRLGDDFDTLVITGPNTGGKTVSLKTLGLFVLMTACGLHIPAAPDSEVAVFEHILADIGDEQSIEQSLSTFSSHMKNIVRIMELVSPGTLVLFDELGSGTDPVEGAALAIAILERARACGAKVAATTHYAELKLYALQTPRVENAACEFDVASLQPTYRLLIAVPGKSNAFAISRRLGLDAALVDRAAELIQEDNRQFETVIAELERRQAELDAEKDIARNERLAAQRIREELERQKESFERNRDKETERARVESQRILSSAREMYNRLQNEMDEIRRQKAKAESKQNLAEAKAKLSGMLSELENTVDPVNKKQEPYKLPRPLKVGDSVQIEGVNTAATVLALPDGAGKVLIQAGIIKMQVDIATLRLVEKNKAAHKPKPAPRKSSEGTFRAASAAQELDLRGMNGEEAKMEADKFLDDSALSGIPSVVLIHGKGTGALRKAIHEFLRHHPHVLRFRLGIYGEGEEGVTIVELK